MGRGWGGGAWGEDRVAGGRGRGGGLTLDINQFLSSQGERGHWSLRTALPTNRADNVFDDVLNDW